MTTPNLGYVWKNKSFGDRETPKDALRPVCDVYLQLTPNSGAFRDSDPTDTHDWFRVIKYQAFPPDHGCKNPLFPEMDEVRGTDNDYESDQEQLNDTHAYANGDWLFLPLILLFIWWLLQG